MYRSTRRLPGSSRRCSGESRYDVRRANSRGWASPTPFYRLWTPHRLAYIKGENKPESADDETCPFCGIPEKSDEDGLIVKRGDVAYAVLNLYPYNPGHLMLVPYRHVADYTDLTESETAEVALLTSEAMTAVARQAAPMASTSASTRAPPPARGSRRICISTSCRGGAETPTSCRSSVIPRCSLNSCATPGSCWPMPGRAARRPAFASGAAHPVADDGQALHVRVVVLDHQWWRSAAGQSEPADPATAPQVDRARHEIVADPPRDRGLAL